MQQFECIKVMLSLTELFIVTAQFDLNRIKKLLSSTYLKQSPLGSSERPVTSAHLDGTPWKFNFNRIVIFPDFPFTIVCGERNQSVVIKAVGFQSLDNLYKGEMIAVNIMPGLVTHPLHRVIQGADHSGVEISRTVLIAANIFLVVPRYLQ